MAKKNSGKYYLRNSSSGTYQDVTTLFEGVNILAVQNADARGKAVNVFTQQWVTSETEDFMITGDSGVIIRENVNITIVFAVGQRYSDTTIDTQQVYDNFINYLTNTDVWIRSRYVDKDIHCVNMDGVEPKTVKLKRGSNSYILGEIKMHNLSKPTSINV